MAKVQNIDGGLGRGGTASRSTGAYSNPQQQTNEQFSQFLANRPSLSQEMDKMVSSVIAKNK
jgi:hypothetical protein